MRYGSVCSGIEAATAAWHPLGWTSAFFSEIDNFPRAVLAHHYPSVPCHGDFTTIGKDTYDPIDLLVGGTPCQAFSVAGLRKGLADERGNLTLEFVRLAQRLRPRWLVWENVPGVLSQDRGRAFAAFLGGLAELGYGFAYRILDAQHFGVPQRRRRVFVVGYLGDWRPPAAVFFERESLLRDLTPRREAEEIVTGSLASRTTGGGGLGTDMETDGGLIAPKRWPADLASTLNAHYGDKMGLEDQHALNGAELFVPATSHSLRADGFDASEDGTGRGTPLIACTIPASDGGPSSGMHPVLPVAFSCKDHGADAGDTAPTLRSMGHALSHQNAGGQLAVAFARNCRGEVRDMDVSAALSAGGGKPGEGYPAVRQSMAVRRLTPKECERLQGFPDSYTAIPWRAKQASECPDGPRYKALGNSMAVPVMRWIGERIELVEQQHGLAA